jgi:hypothetical protein
MITWTAQVGEARRPGVSRYALSRGTVPATSREVIDAWCGDAEFCKWFNALLANVAFEAFRWETPPLTTDIEAQPFEFVVLDSPTLARRPDPEAFGQYFRERPELAVLEFANLGGDAIMVVPSPIGRADVYAHLAAFVRGAPEDQRTLLWQEVGRAMTRRVNATPVWLSTAGAGVSWLHVRLDDRPKYYGFAPYRALPRSKQR